MTDGFVSVRIDGGTVSVPRGASVADIAHLKKPCGGHGKCGKCRVIVHGALSPVTETERNFLSDEEIALGVRLACLTRAEGDCEIITPRSAHPQILEMMATKVASAGSATIATPKMEAAMVTTLPSEETGKTSP